MPREHGSHETEEERFAKITRRVWKAVWKIVAPGAALGLVFMLFGAQLADHKTYGDVAASLLGEIGTGFIVACIAVFGYEYLRDVSGVIEEQREFRDQVALFKEINERAADQALGDDLLRVLEHADLTNQVVATVQQAVDIKERSRTRKADPGTARSGMPASSHTPDILHGDACLSLMADLAGESVKFAETLNFFHEDVSNRTFVPEGREYALPDPREIAGKVLSLLLSSLESGDYYKSVANILFYEQTLMRMFEDAAEAACDRGINIQRLFNVSNFEGVALSREQFVKCKGILHAHFELQKKIAAKHRGIYEIRFYGSALKPFLNEPPFRDDHCPHLATLPRSYFGLFCKKTQDLSLLFFAKEPQRASRVCLAFRNKYDPTEAYFDQMWKVAAIAPNPFAADQFHDNWLDATVATLSQGHGNQGDAAGI